MSTNYFNTVTEKPLILLVFSTLFSIYGNAQIFDDWQSRTSVSLGYKLNRSLSLEGTYYAYMDKNLREYNKSVAAGEVGYKLTSWLKAGIEYRYGIKKRKDEHELRYTMTFDHRLFSRKWKIKYRPMMVMEFKSLNKEYLAEHPIDYYLTNRLTLSYKLSKATELYVFSENYQQIEDGHFGFYRQKSALGSEFKIGNRSKLDTRFDIINKRSGKNNARFVLKYAYTLGYRKQK